MAIATDDMDYIVPEEGSLSDTPETLSGVQDEENDSEENV